MKVSVWDTYVRREDGKTMHFDILVPHHLDDQSIIFNYGDLYLSQKPFKTNSLSTQECKLCHIEQATPQIIEDINKKGFSIIEMENCI
ncbi:DUF2024 family protein [Lacinutrix iliipiscaria]|uniref:DUF2024 family protein n=1 Tax=Lacinutrix iliipiscaria TaxID=1230532 RepID=A0ABW5WNQ9_9FLAO